MALCAPAYGATARKLHAVLSASSIEHEVKLHLTRMADHTSHIETNQDVAGVLNGILTEPDARAIIFNVAMCDFSGQIQDVPSGKYAERLKSRGPLPVQMALEPTPKLLSAIKVIRPDLFLVGFKTTAGADEDGQRDAALRQIQETGADLVLANDTVTRSNLLFDAKGIRLKGSRDDVLDMLTMALQALLK
ncbi:phosphopantothenoylcysteine decarboxylase [Paraburkholderia aspalathi]|nr:phosphopantothenoylcysteine decarboxylase [Paraburkholderia aspalathi]MBK3779975.1 phosphopantothenoylcysteine decarboxylase [Paraburkholderia aspalathi]